MLTVTVDDAYLEAAGPQLRIVANYAVGVNNIDLDAARRRGIVVSNTPDVLTGATAELALTLMLSLLRRVTEGDRFVRRREPWQFSLEFMLGERLAGKTVLIVGSGRIGRETARLVEAFGAVPVLAGRDADLDALLPQADVVSLHVPLTDETRHLIDARRLRLMKRTRGADQHGARAGRRRGRSRRRAPRTARSREPGSTSTSGSRRSRRRCSRSRTSSSRPISAAPRATRGSRWGCSASTRCAPSCSRAARRPNAVV